MLYQLSYFRLLSCCLWISGLSPDLIPHNKLFNFKYLRCQSSSGKRDSNSRPQPWQGCALPTELFPRLNLRVQIYGKSQILQANGGKIIFFIRTLPCLRPRHGARGCRLRCTWVSADDRGRWSAVWRVMGIILWYYVRLLFSRRSSGNPCRAPHGAAYMVWHGLCLPAGSRRWHTAFLHLGSYAMPDSI